MYVGPCDYSKRLPSRTTEHEMGGKEEEGSMKILLGSGTDAVGERGLDWEQGVGVNSY